MTSEEITSAGSGCTLGLTNGVDEFDLTAAVVETPLRGCKGVVLEAGTVL